MSKNLIILILSALVLFGCKNKKSIVKTPQGEVEILSPKKALKAIANKPLPPQWVNIVAGVDVTQKGSSQAGTADIRINQDSILWVELSDNIVGIKAIRAFAMADTVAFYNRIDRTYFAGSYDKVEQKLGTSVPFPFIFNVFQGQLFVQNGTVDVVNGHYILSGEDGENTFMAEIDPFYLDVIHQEYITKTDIMKVDYKEYEQIDGFRFPQEIRVEVIGRENLSADFSVKSIKTGKLLKLPFNISNKYERIQ